MMPVFGAGKQSLAFATGDSEMGRLIHATDWSRTSIGPPETWSQSLRTVIRILLANRFPMLLWWGPDYVSIYNDAYIPILGQKHPWALGKPVRECWSEIWDVLRPLIDTPFHGGPATWSEDLELYINRSGFMEETHFTVAYSPVPDEAAERGIGGVIATVHEITAKIVGQRRGATLRELASTAEARTAEEACVNAAAKLAAHAKDIPFARIYLSGEDGAARLAAATGLEDAPDSAPASIRLDKRSAFWPLHTARATGSMQVVELPAGFAVHADTDPQPTQAVVLPLRSHVAHQFSGFLVAGLNPNLRLDESYTDFLKLVTTQIATAVSTALAYEEERKRADALAEIDRAKTAFFSNVSHEFRTPLTLMLGPLEEMLKEREQLAPAQRERAEVAHRNSLRLLKLVNSLLDFSRIEAGRIHAAYTPVDLASVTRDLASNFQSAVEAAGLKLVVNCARLPEPVYVDLEMWEKIVLNLLSNAFKFTLAGKITVKLKSAHGRAILCVSDTGIGIPEAELPHIFERFHRVEGSRGRSYEGTGIGLALVQELVRMHGGCVKVTSEVGKGSSFLVEIPLGTKHLPADHLAKAAPPRNSVGAEAYVGEVRRWLPETDGIRANAASETPSTGHQPRILLAEDNADMRAYVVRLLDGHMQVTVTNNGQEALASALQDPPDLVLSDVMMPLLDGFGLLRELRAHPSTSAIPVILLSARAGAESRIEGANAGADDYLVKPFSAAELLACLGAHLKLARMRAESLTTMRRLQEISTRLIGKSDLQTLLGEFLGAAIEITRADMGVIQLLNPTTGELGIGAHRGVEPGRLEVLRVADASTAHAVRQGQRVLVEDVKRSPVYDSGAREGMQAAGARAVQSTPLVTRSGKLLGVLSTHFRSPGRPTESDLQSLDVVVRQAADLIENSVNAEALRTSEERLTMAIEAAGMGTWDVDLSSGSSRWSRRHFEILGYAPDPNCRASMGMWRSRIHPDDLERVDLALETARRTGERYSSEHRIVRGDNGETRWIAEFGRYVANPEGKAERFVGISFDVTERVQATRSALLLGAIVDSSDDAIVSKNLDGVVTTWNKSAERLFGYTAAEAIGQTIAALIIPADRQDEEPGFLARLRRGERIEHVETVRRRKDGTLLDVSLSISPVKDDRGRVIGASKIARDITDRKQAEERLRKSEERFRAMVTATSDVVYQMGPDWTEMRHLAGREFIADTLEPSRTWLDKYIPPDDRPQVTQAIQEAVRKKSVFSLEHRIIRADGSMGWTLSRAVPILNGAGEITEWFGAASDITDLKNAEEALRRSEEGFRQLAEVGPQIVWLTGPAGELEFVNRRWVEFSGLDLEATRDPEQRASRLHPEDRVLEHWREAFDKGAPFELEARLRARTGEFRWFMMRAVPVRDEQGRPQRWFGTSTDIHETKLLQLELTRANQDLEQFAYSASHDLQEPLRSVKIFSELVADRYGHELNPQAREFLDNVRDGANRMEVLVQDLLAYTRTARLDKPAQPADANEALQTALANLSGAISETAAIVDCGVLPAVRVHATQLQQLFQNLIGNAIKYHSPGKAPIVHIAAVQKDGSWLFSVKDNGIGIEPEYKETIFGLFKRLHTRDEYSGTGIGLAICQRIVERYHGRIWVESEPGQGSTFYFTLPV